MDDSRLNTYKKLMEVQKELKVEKSKWNDFGKFYSRSKEDILEAVKPLLFERNMVLVMHDSISLQDNKWVYVCVKAKLIDIDNGQEIAAYSIAREPESKPKMDSSQTTGSAASYAGKRALGNLFALDDTADADQIEQPDKPFVGACTACGNQFQFDSKQQMENSVCTCGNTQFQVV